MNKRGQFFILTAVILSTLLFSLAFTVNEVVSIERQNNFYDYSEDVEREAKNVIDYQVYQGFSSVSELDSFVELLQNDFREKAVESNFMIIYGNEDSVTIKNLGTQGITITDSGSGGDPLVLSGASESVPSNIRIGGIAGVMANNFKSEGTEIRFYKDSFVTFVEGECRFEYCEENSDEGENEHGNDDCVNNPNKPANQAAFVDSCVDEEFDTQGGTSAAQAGGLSDTQFDEIFEVTGPGDEPEIRIDFDGHEYVFPIKESNQVIFIIQRDVLDETYVDIR